MAILVTIWRKIAAARKRTPSRSLRQRLREDAPMLGLHLSRKTGLSAHTIKLEVWAALDEHPDLDGDPLAEVVTDRIETASQHLLEDARGVA